MATDLSSICVPPTITIRQAIQFIDANRRGIVLVVDGDRRLIATITDGDIRRALLAGAALEDSLAGLLAKKTGTPVTVPADTSRSALLDMMQRLLIRQIPLVDAAHHVVALVTWDELLPAEPAPLRAVIMAGGSGTRLRPLTEHTPKPMLPVGNRPLLELIIDQLKQAGIHHLNLSTHYKREVIEQHFGDGSKFGVALNYVPETQPLGTAGALGLMAEASEPILVINGDVLTKVNFRALLDFHRENRADLTVAVRQYDMNVPFGVVETDGALVSGIAEKPVFKFFVNAGIYLIEPAAQRVVPKNQRFDMTDLIQELIRQGRRVASFPIHEYWLDVGQPTDYQKAQEDFKDRETP
jgi:dTDP-glucose pyrophosphorylase